MLRQLVRLILDALIYGSGNLLQPLLTFFLLPLYTRYLDKQEYGLLAMVALIPTIYTTLAASGMRTAIFRHYFIADDPSQHRRMLSTALWAIAFNTVALLGLGIIFSDILAYWLVGDQAQGLASSLVRWSLLSAASVVVIEVPRSLLQMTQRVKLTSFINALNSLVTILTTVYLVVVTGAGVYGVVWGNLIGNVVAAVLMFALTFKEFSLIFDVSIWKRMAAYALPFLPHRLQAVGMVFFGNYLVTQLLGLNETGLFAVAGRLGMPLLFASTALQTAWSPHKFKIYAEDPNAGPLFRSIFTYLLAGLLFLWLGLACWGPDVLRLMTAPKYHAAAGLVWAIGFSRVCQAICPMVSTGIELASKTTQLPLASLAGLVVVIAGCFWLVPLWGANGAALATGAGWLAMAAGYYIVSQRQVYIPYDWPVISTLVILAVIGVGLSVVSQHLPVYLRILSAAAICAVYPLFVVAILFRSSTERARMTELYVRIHRRWQNRGNREMLQT